MPITFLTNEDRAELEQQIEEAKQNSGGNVDQSGLTTVQIDALHGMFKVCAFINDDVSAEYAAFKEAFGITDSGDNGEDSGGESEDTHTHSYTSSVTTAATCTTAGVRTYTCSCGETYTESIPATGHNYVDGVCTVCGAADPNAESGGEDSGESADTTWTANEAYTNYNWTDGIFINNGAEGIMATYSTSDYMPCDGVTTLTSSLVIGYGAFYDSSKAYISKYSATANADVEVPENAAYFRISGATETIKTITIVPDKVYDENVGIEWEDGVAYADFGWTDGYYITGTGIPANYNGFSVSDFMPCNGASTIQFVKTSYGNTSYTAFYDSKQSMISGSKFSILGDSATNEIAVPDGAAYFRFTAGTDDKASYSATPHA